MEKLWALALALALACLLVIQGSASVDLVGEGFPHTSSKATVLIDIAPIGATVQPPSVMPLPPLNPLPTPEMPEGPISSTPPTVPSVPPPSQLPVLPPMNTEDTAPVMPATPPPENPELSAPPPVVLPPPAIPVASPPDKPDVNPSAPAPTPPSPSQTNPPESSPPPVPVSPVSSTPPPPSLPLSPPPYHPVLPNEPPSLSPEPNTSVPPPSPRNASPPVPPQFPVEPPSIPPAQNVPPAIPTNAPPPAKPPLPVDPPSSPPEQNVPPPAIPTNAPPPVKPPLPVEPPSNPPEQNVPPTIPVSPPVRPPLPVEPPSSPPEQNAPPTIPRNDSPPVQPPSPQETPSSPPEKNVPSVFTPPPSISPRAAITPLPAPRANNSSNSYPPVSHSPSKGPPPSKSVTNSTWDYNISPTPSMHVIPPASSRPAHMNHSKSAPTFPHKAPPPTSAGSPNSPTPNVSPSHSSNIHNSPMAAPSPPPMPGHANISPKSSPPRSSPRHPKARSPPPPPWAVLPPPPPQKECAPLICTDPLTYGPPEYPCVCVLPIQVELRLGVALYTFFPLVSELAAEVAAGVFMKQSQVRIMGANAAENNPDKTIVLIDLVPVGKKFDDTTAYLTFQRLWQKQVPIKPSIFGDYDVLYVKYPGLPPSPPLPPSTTAIVSKPFPGRSNDPLKPIGVDARGKQRRNHPTGTIIATILLSAFVAAILLCVIAWILLVRNRDCVKKPDPTPPNTARSLAKSSAVATSIVGSGPSSPAFSLGSSIVGYTGSMKTFSSADIEIATDNFDETRVLGEGGFGRVYSGVLEDGTPIAVKVLKRYDQQGNREFLAEVEMLTRLHHRNLVKLIGICTDVRTRCLVYELITNGSVESHLHGIDKEAAPLDWSARLKIALGAARALAYLHEDSSPRVIHRDFKASNILLEDDYTPKVSDFGLARTALDGDNKHISTRVMGTFGYVAPEYAMTGHLLVKSDVYSYGVVLLELLTGRKPVDMSQPAGQENLVSWARPLLTTPEGLQSMIDPYLLPDCPFDIIAKVSAIASMCVQPEVSHRPFMGEVVQALKLVSNECDRMKELLLPRSSTLDLPRSSTNSDQSPDHHILNQSPVSSFDYRLDCERDLTMSELLSSSAHYDRQDSSSYRRHSSSGPIRTGRTKQLWKTIGRLSGGSVSEHGVLLRLWPGSH